MLPVVVIASLVVLGLGLWTPGGFDTTITGWIDSAFGGQPALLRLFLLPTEPYLLVPLIALMLLLCALARRWDDVLLCALGTALPVALNTWVLKPLFDRTLDGYLAYPSGHTVSLVSTLTVLVVLARPGTATHVTATLGVVIGVAAGIGLVGAGYHYPTDVFGGACFAVAAVLSARALRPGRARSGGSPHAGTSSGSPPAASPR